MNVALLRLASRHRDGSRRWVVPGFDNGIALFPRAISTWPGESAAVHWPYRDLRGAEVRRGVRLDWHRTVAKSELRALIATVKANETLDVFVAHHADQGYRMDLVGRTEQEVWDKLADAGEQRDTPKARRKAMAYGWSVVPMTLTRKEVAA